MQLGKKENAVQSSEFQIFNIHFGLTLDLKTFFVFEEQLLWEETFKFPSLNEAV